MYRLFISLIVLLCVACSPQENRQQKWFVRDGKIKVLTTLAMIDDLVAQVGKERVDSLPLIHGELDPHTYELVKGDGEKFERADLIFYNGLGLEHGLSLRQNLEGNPKAIAVGERLLQNDPDAVLSVDGQYDPHIWMDSALWVQTVDPIVEALSQLDPERSDFYARNGAQLKERLQRADARFFATLQAIPAERRFLVTSHDAFNYFTRHYLAEPGEKEWQKRCRAPEGLAPDAQLSVGDLVEVITHAEMFGVYVLFPESNVNRDALKRVVQAGKERGMEIRICEEELYGDAMGKADSYLEMIEHNVAVIVRALEEKR